MRRWIISTVAGAVFGVLALGSGGSGEDGANPDAAGEDDVADVEEDEGPPPLLEPTEFMEEEPAVTVPEGSGALEAADWLDKDLAPCPDGTVRVGAVGPTEGTPFFVRPALAPPPGLDVNGAIGADEGARADFGGDDAARWCAKPDGTPHGPIVVSREAGRWRMFANLENGVLNGPMEGWSYVEPDDGTPPVERHEKELEGGYTDGDPVGKWTAKCPLQDMAAICPAGAVVEGTFDRTGRKGRWIWSWFDGVSEETSTVDYVRDMPKGQAVHSRRVMAKTCESRGPVDARGRQGTWTERCTEEGRKDPPVVRKYVNGEETAE